MPSSQAAKRLARILANEDYGPKLARMNRRDEAYILDLIERNQGKKARSEILRLDESRRVQRRERERSKRQRGYVIDKNVLRRQAANNIIRQVRGNPTVVHKHVTYMADDDLSFATRATRTEIQDRARERGYVEAPDIEYDINPFWYK